jgi:hypothetical protein
MARHTLPPARRDATSDRAGSSQGRRRAAEALLVSALFTILIVACYFLLPFETAVTTATALTLVLGLGLVLAVLVWQVRSILRSPYPRVRAAAALATSVPLFLVVFSAAYFVMDRSAPESFNQPLTRMDAAYFTVTVFSTVGFGDIVPVTSAARATATVQMLGDVLLVGVVVRVIVRAAQRGVERQENEEANRKRDPEDAS